MKLKKIQLATKNVEQPKRKMQGQGRKKEKGGSSSSSLGGSSSTSHFAVSLRREDPWHTKRAGTLKVFTSSYLKGFHTHTKETNPLGWWQHRKPTKHEASCLRRRFETRKERT